MRKLSLMMAVILGPPFTGNLWVNGVVLTNAVPVPSGGTVRSGDTITTRPASLAVVTSAAYGRMEVRSDSEARITADRVQLLHGAVASSKMAVEVEGYTIRPENTANSWFAVAQRNGRVTVAAHRGGVLIASAAGTMPLAEGSCAQEDQTQNPPPAGQPKEEKGKKKKRPGAAAGAAAGGWTIGSLSHTTSVAVVAGVGAGVAAATTGAAVALSDSNPSPSN